MRRPDRWQPHPCAGPDAHADPRQLDPQRVVALGGPAAVCDGILAQAGNA